MLCTQKRAYVKPYSMKKILASLLLSSLFSSSVLAYTSPQGCSHPFTDAVGHWGEDEICALYERGNIQGYTERTFMPERDITRAEFLKMALLSLGYNVVAVSDEEFTDSNPGDWHYKYGTFARSKGYLSGYGDGSWRPNASITRAEAVKLIVDIAGISDYETENRDLRAFWDVEENDWFAEAVHVGLEYQLVGGYADGGFHPDDEITRAEAAALVNRTWTALYTDYPVGLEN